MPLEGIIHCVAKLRRLLGLAFGVTAATLHAAPARQPDVLFISVDDLNDWIGPLHGHPQTKTPNFDRLAAHSQLFTNAYCPAASCNPSRSAIFSGIAPYRSGIYHNLQPLRDIMPDAELLPRYFSRHGYWSAGAGKLLHYIIDPPSWDDYFPEKSTDNPLPSTFYPEKRPVSLPRGGPWQYVETDWAALDITDEQFGGDWLVTRWISEKLAAPPADQSFFLACGLYRPHEPWFVPKKYFEPFPLDSIQPGPGFKPDDLSDVPPLGQRVARNRYFPHIQEHGQWKSAIQAYLASIYYADTMLGRVLDALEKSPRRDNTIVVLWSDHGWHLGEKEHWQKYTGWRLCDRIPLMIHVPAGFPALPDGTRDGSTCTRPVSLMDLFPTLTELCGLPAKTDNTGHSLLPLLRDPATPWPHAAVTQLDKPGNLAISTERWRYIHYNDGGEELYDIETDPYEWTNLATFTESQPKLAELRALIPANPKPLPAITVGASDMTRTAPLDFIPSGKAPSPPPQTTGNRVPILIRNVRESRIQLYWVDPSGEIHDYGVVEKTAERQFSTFAGHSWLVRDVDGKNLGHFTANEKSGHITVE